MVAYKPKRGDIIWLDFEPQTGSEINKRRPALVLTPQKYNTLTGLCIVCPLTSKVKGYPFEVEVEVEGTEGAIKSDQVKSLDWRRRNARFITRVSGDVLEDTLSKIKALIFLS